MKTRNLLLIPMLISLLAGCASSRNAQNDAVSAISWQPDTLTIDGNDGDWLQPLVYEDKKLGVAYGFFNDSTNLYIQLVSHDEYTTLNILRGGMTVYINNHGVQETAGAAGLGFPTGNRVRKEGNMLNERPELQQDKRLALQQVGDYVLFGFPEVKTPETFDYPKPNPEGIQAAVGLNTAGELVYEAMIPLASFKPGRRSFALGIYIEQLPGMGNNRGGGGISIGGGLGMGSFGRGGGVGISIGSGSLGRIGGNKGGKPVKFWKEVVVSQKPRQQ